MKWLATVPKSGMSEDRAKDRHKPRATIASADDEGLWTELGELVGTGQRSEVTRQLWAAFLNRPGAKMPRRKNYEEPSNGEGPHAP